MHVWVVVLALLALAVFFLFISLFLKDNQNEEEIDELAEGLLELNREVYSLKKKIQELEGTTVYKGPSVEPTYEEVRAAKQAEVRVAEKPVVEEVQETTPVEEEVTTVEEVAVEESGRLHNVTKQQIITLFSHGNSVETISEQLNVPVSTVQLVIDNYFEADAK
ncbi:helix-turn-helix domain-containing protein [uncultured Granulicatella sp.]|uniref:helix-turn-helix domain-containing protein n=1 Tax=uncultured Granulicatella sp. TaxID=316089 RepID=UPI002616DEC4|nr:helix-turn-helix domain-containing protein [uncultured Granulicatella sp.]